MRLSLLRQVSLRLLLALLISGAVTILLGAWFHGEANERVRSRQLEGALGYYARVVYELERNWGREAYAFKARLEYTRILEDAARREVRLNSYLSLQRGETEFADVLILDRQGRRLFRFPVEDAPLPAPRFQEAESEAWAYDQDRRLLFRVFRQNVWVGDGNGELLLYRRADHHLLASFAYPGSEVALLWEGVPVAHSLGSEGLARAGENGDAGGGGNRVAWDPGHRDTPSLRVEILHAPAFHPQDLFVPIAVSMLVFALAAWAILGRWSWVMLGRVRSLEQAQREFAAGGSKSETVEAVLRKARRGRTDELSALAGTLERFMDDFTRHEAVERASRSELQESEQRFRSMVEAINDWYWIVDENFVYTYASPKAADLLGLGAAEVLGRRPFDFMPAAEAQRVEALFRGCASRAQPVTAMEVTFLHRDGSARVFESSATPVIDGSGRFLGFRGLDRDVTARRHTEERLALAGLVFETADEGIMVTDAESRIVAVNPAFERITGYAASEVLGGNPRLLKSGRQDEAFYGHLWQVLGENGQWQGDLWNRRKNGETYVQSTSIVAIRGADRRPERYVAIFHDVTLEKRQADEIEYQATHDPLTGLPNRRLLRDRIDGAIARAERDRRQVAVLMLDLDGFKHVNDSLGHHVGDLLLVQVAQRLRECVRGSDTLSRLGGDEFTVVLENITRQHDAQNVASKVLGQIQESYRLESTDIFVTASIGIAVYPEDGTNTESLMANADTAMYQAKLNGRNCYRFFTRAMHEAISRRVRIETEMRRALQGGGFVLHYQPVVDLAAHRVVRAEALLRWNHPEQGELKPAEFIPVAEESGLIVPLGEWVMEEAARQLGAWGPLAAPGFRVGVNVSAHQFSRGGLVELVERSAASAGARPDQIIVEITESLFMDDPVGQRSAVLRELMDLGVRIAIDDFGTGYSSLSYLKNLPINSIKIDRAFIHGIPTDRQDMALIDAVLALCESFGLDVTAEGVETEAQAAHLRQRGCHFGQGFLFGKPRPAAEFAARYLGAAGIQEGQAPGRGFSANPPPG